MESLRCCDDGLLEKSLGYRIVGASHEDEFVYIGTFKELVKMVEKKLP